MRNGRRREQVEWEMESISAKTLESQIYKWFWLQGMRVPEVAPAATGSNGPYILSLDLKSSIMPFLKLIFFDT